SDRVPMMMPKVVNPWAKPATYVSSVCDLVASAPDDDPWLADAPGTVGSWPCRLGHASSGRVTNEAARASTAGPSEGWPSLGSRRVRESSRRQRRAAFHSLQASPAPTAVSTPNKVTVGA